MKTLNFTSGREMPLVVLVASLSRIYLDGEPLRVVVEEMEYAYGRSQRVNQVKGPEVSLILAQWKARLEKELEARPEEVMSVCREAGWEVL